jgi:hypothetical protein
MVDMCGDLLFGSGEDGEDSSVARTLVVPLLAAWG